MAARLRYAHLLCLCLVTTNACKLDEKPPAGGGLVVGIDTDMSMPKDIDEVRLEVTQGAAMLFQHNQQLDENAAALPLEIEVPDVNDSAPVLVRALGMKDGDVRVERSAIATVPTSYLGYLRLILNYLCDGMVGPDGGSSCGPTMTCIQGTCGAAAITTSLPDFYKERGSGPAVQNASTACFDVARCLSNATEMNPELAADGCSFESSKLFATDINVALRLEPGSAGVCTQTACWIVLDSDGDGFRIGDDARVFLPETICAQRSQGANLRVAMSIQCPSKKQSMPLCRDGSSDPVTGDPDGPVTVGMTMSPVSDACSGGGQRSCEMCGSQARMCQSGLWSEFGMCADQGVCVPETVESCGVNGIRTCGGDCTWGDCENQTCDGPATRSCGNCGTQHRSCNNGVWSEWSACGEEGVCLAGATQACGSGGTQACMGNCAWGECTMQVCPGAASEPCGNCGTHTRTCDPSTATWSDWGACEGEGECRPDSTQPCGRDGEQTCGGNCRWDVACAGQTCEGAARRACGLCGTQTRTCDMMTGEYSDWSACFGEGECMPDSITSCGNGGERVCGGMCRWGSACTGQSCTGASSERCGDCGTRSRTCDTNTGAWSGWSECRNQGDCTPGETRTCGSGGTQSCSTSCRWSDACPGQMCDGPDQQVCSNNQCVTQRRTCNMNTGDWDGWNPTTCTQGCTPGTLVTGNCPPNSGRLCDSSTCSSTMSPCTCVQGYMDCAPDDAVSCVNLQDDGRNCGRCGNACPDDRMCMAGVCVCRPGRLECVQGGACINPNSNAHCGACDTVCTGDLSCENGMCRCPAGEMSCDNSNNCNNLQNDPLHCGRCGNACTGGRICMAGECQCQTGQQACDGATARCLDLATDENHCGACGNACASGQVCVAGMCQVQCTAPEVNCGGQCVNLQASGQHCGACGMTCMNNMTCQAGRCACAPGYGPCGAGGACVPLNTISNCGACGNMCMDGAMCMGGDCVCTGNQTECNGDCVNLQNDEMNCGRCGVACPANVMCTGGECDCPANQDRCGGPGTACIPLNTSTNCGSCGNACDAGEMCRDGMCVTTCTAPAVPCSGMCVNTQSSTQHCGACNNACMTGMICRTGNCDCPDGTDQCAGPNSACVPLDTAANCGTCNNACTGGATCVGGMCQTQCTAPEIPCGGMCVNAQNSEQHCGACNNTCTNGTTCQAGRCACPSGSAQCDGPNSACIPLNTAANCGRCDNTCDDGAMCMGGVCGCPGNQTSCDGACTNTQNDPNHCGNCETDCGGRTCSGGRCQCASNEHRCDGECEVRSVDSCGASCAPCRPIPNGVPTGCSGSDQCQYDCAGPQCGNACCAAGQVCTAGQCTTPQPPPEGGSGGGGSPPIIIN